MDARIDVFAVLGLHLGEAHVIRNAGGRVTEDVLRSLALSSHVLGVDTAVLMQHTKCGLAGATDDELRAITGADMGVLPIDDHSAALREDLDVLVSKTYLAPVRQIAGFVYDVEGGHIDDVVRWGRPAWPTRADGSSPPSDGYRGGERTGRRRGTGHVQEAQHRGCV